MQLKSLTLTALGLLFLHQNSVYAEPAAVLNDVAIVHGGNGIAPSYLSVYGTDDDVEADFELSDEVSHLYKRADSCSKYHTVSGSDSCVKLAKKYGVTLQNIYDWNPQIKKGCPNLNNGKKYCVGHSSGSSSSSSSSSCAQTHKASSSDTCIKVAKKYGLSLSEFYDLNPSIDSSCSNMNTGKKYCVEAGSSSSVSSLAIKAAKKSTKKTTKKTTKKKTTTKKSTKEVRKKLQSGSDFTYYWIAQPSDYSGGKSVSVKTCGGSTIGKVGENYADALVMEGTGIVGSKIVNLGGCSCSGYKCFELVNKNSDPYGLTSYGGPLRPYITVASNDIKKNTKIYVPALVGWKLPGTNKKHNGCLLVDDQSWSFSDKHIDFYVYTMDNYESLDKSHRINSVDIYEGGSCKLINYDI